MSEDLAELRRRVFAAQELANIGPCGTEKHALAVEQLRIVEARYRAALMRAHTAKFPDLEEAFAVAGIDPVELARWIKGLP